MKYFTASVYKQNKDSFFTVYRNLFSQIEMEEEDSLKNDSDSIQLLYTHVTSFGFPTTKFNEDFNIDGEKVH